MKKIGIVLGTAVLVGMISLIPILKQKTFVVRVSEEELRSRIEKKLPYTKKYLAIFSVTLSNPRVNLVSGSDRINMGIDAGLSVAAGEAAKAFGGQVDISGVLRYDAATGGFFLLEPEVDRLSIQGLPEKYTAGATQAVSSALKAFYREHPVYTLRPTDFKKAAARLLLRSVVVENEELVITLGL